MSFYFLINVSQNMKSYTYHSPSSFDTIQVFFQRAYITISINPHFHTFGKMLSLTLTIHSYIIYLFFFFLLLLIYIMASFMTVHVDFIEFLPKNNPGNLSFKMSKIRFFQVEFLCSVTLNLTFTFKYVYPFNFGFCLLVC